MRASSISVYSRFSSCLLANMPRGPKNCQPMTGPRTGAGTVPPAGAGAANIGDKENMLTDLPINLKTLIEAVDERLLFGCCITRHPCGRGWPCLCGIRGGVGVGKG